MKKLLFILYFFQSEQRSKVKNICWQPLTFTSDPTAQPRFQSKTAVGAGAENAEAPCIKFEYEVHRKGLEETGWEALGSRIPIALRWCQDINKLAVVNKEQIAT